LLRGSTAGAGAALSLLVFAVGPGGLQAQTPADDDTPPTGARAVLEADLRLAEMAGRWGLVGGGRALLSLPSGFRLGVAGHQVLRRVDDAPGATGPDRTMAFGYAGIVAEVDLPLRVPLMVRVFGGAGAVTVRDQAVGTRVGSDIVGVVEPELVYEIARARGVALNVGAGYRHVFASHGPIRVGAGDLRSTFLSLSLRLGPL
jgi:hypothetical protein